MIAAIAIVACGATALVGLALWRSARAGTGVWWPPVVAILVLGGLCLAVLRLGFT